MQNKSTFFITAAILSLGFVVGAAWFGHYYYLRGNSGTVNVTGSATKEITSDLAEWQASFSVNAGLNDLKSGNDQINREIAIVKDYLKTDGINESEANFYPVSVEPQYEQAQNGNFTQNVIGYTIMESVDIQSQNVDGLTKAAKNSGTLISEGIIISNSQLQYYYSKLADLKKDMIAQATQNAKDRAQSITQNAGSRLGQLRSASQGVMQITAPNSTDLSGEGSYDTSSIQKEITAIVHANFGIQ